MAKLIRDLYRNQPQPNPDTTPPSSPTGPQSTALQLTNSAQDPKQNGATGITSVSMADRDGIAVLC